MGDKWYLARQGEQYGPYSWEEILTYHRSGNIVADDLLWNQSLTDWQRADRVPGLIFRDSTVRQKVEKNKIKREKVIKAGVSAAKKIVSAKAAPWKVVVGDRLPQMPFGVFRKPGGRR